MKSLTIIGGGITGLAAAYLAAKAGLNVRVLEGTAEVGGLLRTFEIGGNRLEYFYHHFFTHDAEIHWLLEELGLLPSIFYQTSSMGVYRDRAFYPFSKPIHLLKFKPMGFLSKARFALSSTYLGKLADWKKYENLPALEWFRRYAGKETTDSLWEPMLRVKFGPYAEQVPLSWMIGRLQQRMNSRKGGEEKLGYLNGSLHVLLNKLLEALREMKVEIQTRALVEACEFRGMTMKAVRTSLGTYEDEYFLFTLPTNALPPLFHKAHPEYSAFLSQTEYFGAVCTILEMTSSLSEYYWLNIADPGMGIGGVIEQTNFIPSTSYGGSHIAYLSRYFSKNEAIATWSDQEIMDEMLRGVKKVFPNFSEQNLKDVYVFRTRTAATVCDLGFSKKVPRFQTPISNMGIANMNHIYPDERSVNNSIRVAANALSTLGLDIPTIPQGPSLSGLLG